MLIHPQIDPVLISFGPLAIRWYALSYIVGFVLFIWLGRRRIAAGNSVFTREQLDDFLFWGVVGVILGGRLGYILFYQAEFYFQHPIEMFKIWKGGLSFHGGFLGVCVAIVLFARKHGLPLLGVFDSVAPLTPLGFACVRAGGNFVNGELWGRVTDPNAFWAMGFPQARAADLLWIQQHESWAGVMAQYGMLPRHPSQLYQAALEGLLLFAVLWWFSREKRPRGQVASLFLLGYGIARFVAEFAREPDDFMGFLALGLSMGQWLSVPMILVGTFGLWYCRRR